MTTINDASPFGARKTLTIKEKWDRLRGQEHGIDYARAELLHEVFLRLDRDERLLKQFIVAVLGEYAGKRPAMFVRFVIAFDAIKDSSVWTALGGKSVVLLARLKGTERRRAMVKVRNVLTNTRRETVSEATFRSILEETLGDARYNAILTEPGKGGNDTCREQLRVLKGFVLTALEKEPKVKRLLTARVKEVLGIDLVE